MCEYYGGTLFGRAIARPSIEGRWRAGGSPGRRRSALRVYVGLRVAGTGWGHYVTRMPRASKLRGVGEAVGGAPEDLEQVVYALDAAV